MAEEVGGAYVSIHADTAALRQEVEEGLKGATAGQEPRVPVHLDLDDAAAKAGLTDFEAKKTEAGKSVTTRVDLDDATFQAKFAEVKAAADSIKGRADSILVDVRGDVEAELKLRTIKEAADRLVERSYGIDVTVKDLDNEKLTVAALTEQLDKIRPAAEDASKGLADLGVQADGSGNSIDNLGKKASAAAGDGSASGGGMGALASAAILLGPALVPIGAAGIAAIGGIAAMAAQGTIGLGLFALAAKPVITSLNTASDAQQKYAVAVATSGANSSQAQTALTAMHAALDQLTPSEQKAAAALGDFKQQYQTWTKSFDPTILPLLTGGLNIARTAMTDFTPIIASVGGALKGFESNVAAIVQSGSFARFSAIFGGQSADALTTFGNLLVGVGKAFAGLDLAFQPLIVRMEDGLDGLANRLANFGAGAQGNLGIQAFIAYVEKEGPVVIDTIVQIGKDIEILAKALAPLGASYLSGLDLLAKAVGEIASFSPGLVQAAAGLLSFGKAAQLLGLSGGSISGIVKDLGALGTISVGGSAVSGLGKLAATAGSVVASMGALGLTLGDVAGPVGIAVAALLSLTNVMSQGLDTSAAGASQYVKAFVAGLQGVSDPVAAVNRQIAALGKEISDVQNGLAANPITTKSTNAQSDAYQALVGHLQDLVDKQNDLQKILPGLKSDQDAFNAAQAAAASGTANFSAQMVTLRSQLQNAKSSQDAFAIGSQAVSQQLTTENADVTNLTNALNILDGTYLSAQAATLAQKQAVLGFGTALQSAHGDLTGNSAASLAAQQSANSFATSLYNSLIPALVKNGDSAGQITQITGGTIAAFDAAAVKAGFTASQVKTLNATYNLTPKEVATAITLAGASGAISQADELKQKLDAIAAATYTAHVYEQLSTTFVPGGLLPGAAKGTDFHPGGLSWVGEEGPELLQLPRGSKVASNPQSMGMVSAGLVSPPGYASGVGFDAMGYGIGNQFNSGLDRALANDQHTVTIVGGSGRGVGGSGGGGGAGNPLHPGFGDLPAFRGSGGGAGADPFKDVTTAIVASLSSLLQQMRTVALNQGQQVIDAMTKTTTTLKNGTVRVSSLPGNTVLDQAQIDAIASKLPTAIGAAIEKAGPLTVSQLKSLFAKLNADVPLSDIDAIAKKLPTEIVDELKKAGPLTVAQFKSLADSLTKTLNSASGDITKGLHGTFAQLSTEVGDAKKAIDKAFGGTELATIIDSLAKNFDFLSTKAKESLSTITSQLSAAQTGLASIKSQISQSASNLESPFNITSVTGTSFPTGGGSSWTAPVTGSNIIASLQADVKSLKTYRALLDTLKGWGLSTELLAELVAAGPGQGMAAAQALVAGGKKEVNLADVLQGQIDATSTQIATISATAVIGGKTVGLAQAEGIVTGLEASKSKITHELDVLAKDMKAVIDRALDITGSSSGVFKGVGEQMIQGLLDGAKGASGAAKTEFEQIAKSVEQALGIKPSAGAGGAAGSARWPGTGGGWAGNAGWSPSAKLKQKALAFDAGTLPGGSGSGSGALALTYAPTFTVNGDVGPEKFEAKMMTLLKNDRDVFVSEMQRELGRF